MTIGVFDSGAGGLTVLQALRRSLPRHDFLYLGDTARVPYGRKPPQMVVDFATGIAEFLCDQGVGALVVACNTASAVALEAIRARCPVPVWGVVDPGVEAATRATRTRHVGVIGTAGTIASGVYQERLAAKDCRVWARACPMLVHVVEEGLAESEEAELLARHYLKDQPEIDTLILGCTHYPLLSNALASAAGEGVTLVDSAAETARAVARAFCGEWRGHGRVKHFVTGDPAAFEHTARSLGGVDGEVVALSLNDLKRSSAPPTLSYSADSEPPWSSTGRTTARPVLR